MQAVIAIIVALLVSAVVLWFFFAPRKAYRANIDGDVQAAVSKPKLGCR